MDKLNVSAPDRLRLIRAIGCIAYPAGLGIVIALALFIKSMI